MLVEDIDSRHTTFCSYKKLAIFTTNVHTKNECLFNNTEMSCEALNRQFPEGAVISWPSVHRVCKPLSILRFIVFVVSGCAIAYFLFSEGKEIFLIQFFLGGKVEALLSRSCGMLGFVRLSNVLTPV